MISQAELPQRSAPRPGSRKQPTPKLACEGCAQEQDAPKFKRYLSALVDLADTDPPALLCDTCAVYGPPSENPLNSLTGAELKGIEILASGGSFRAAARAMNTSVANLVRRLEGRSNDRKVFRQAYKALLIQAGITPNKLVEKISEALEAEKFTFTKDGTYQQPDHGARLKAVALAQRALELEDRATERAVAVDQQNNFFFDTNLGNGEKTVEDAYEVFAERIDE